ncbi:MAG: type II toxin-antitoxin system RelE/ParE family toxin [Limisphaerales bacterium]
MLFVEDAEFHRRRLALLGEADFFVLLDWLEAHPETGRVIPRSGGLRKLRWALPGRGKRGGARVIYFWWISGAEILLLDIYAKNDKENLSADELRKLKGRVKP